MIPREPVTSWVRYRVTIATEKVVGLTEPRVWTKPLDSHVNPLTGELLDQFTDGPAVIAFAEEILKITLYPWQIWFFNHALELDATGEMYRFRIIITMVARQNGKTTVENILALWHMYALESGMVIGTAQSLDRSEEAWKDCLALAELDDETNDMIVDRNFGHPKFFNLSNGCEYRVAAATRKGGRGFSGDLILLDELREHTNWQSWASVTNTMNARPLAQAFAFSNAGDEMSIVLRFQRALAHKELGWPDGDDDKDLIGENSEIFEGVDPDLLPEGWDELTTALFEWSAAPTALRTDVWAIAQANPSMDHKEVSFNCPTLRSLLAALRGGPVLEFDQEVLCRFTAGSDGGPFPTGTWDATRDPEATPGEGGDIVVCVEISEQRDLAYVARAGRYEKELPPINEYIPTVKDVAVVGIAAEMTVAELIPYLIETRDTYKAVVLRSESGAPTANLLEDLRDAELEDGSPAQLPVQEWPGPDVIAAHMDMCDRLIRRAIEHLPHRGMDTAALSAVALINPGGAWRIDIRRSPSDTAALYAAIGAVWGLDHMPEEESIYATQPVFVIKRRGF